MPGKTSIQWTDYSTNPFKARRPDGKLFNYCAKISAGCANCYAATLTHRWSGPDYTAKAGADLKPVLVEAELQKLLRFKPREPWRMGRPVCRESKPMVFAHDMTDAFLDFWPDSFLDRFFAVVALRPDVIFQVLTKRPERMLGYFSMPSRYGGIAIAAQGLGAKEMTTAWPLPNLHLGVSVENQKHADERIPLLLQTPAAVRFVSYEPALGPVELGKWLYRRCDECDSPMPCERHTRIGGSQMYGESAQLNWIILGGESGPGARPCDVAWIRSAVEQCKAAGVACFVKQLGSCASDPENGLAGAALRVHPDGAALISRRLRDSKGGDIDEFPDDLKVREFPRLTPAPAVVE